MSWISGNPEKDGLYVGEHSNGYGLVVILLQEGKTYFLSGNDLNTFRGVFKPESGNFAFKRYYEIPKPPQLNCIVNISDMYMSESLYTQRVYSEEECELAELKVFGIKND